MGNIIFEILPYLPNNPPRSEVLVSRGRWLMKIVLMAEGSGWLDFRSFFLDTFIHFSMGLGRVIWILVFSLRKLLYNYVC